MVTFQDLQKLGDNEKARMDFVYNLINKHKSSEEYEQAQIAEEYARQKNRTIMWYVKMLYTMSGEAVPDNYSANYKLCSNFFYKFVTQEVQFLLGNGVTWQGDAGERLGKDFDSKLQEAGYEALVGGESFGYWNLDHMEVFKLTEFAPLYDEENSALMAGVRFWQIDEGKPLRATLYEVDGYTEYIWNKREENGQVKTVGEVYHEKRTYKLNVVVSPADGERIYNGENYPAFPIVPLWGNQYKQSTLVGLRSEIDAYDLIRSGFANDVDDASQIYWTIQNAGGMDDVDLAKFVERIKTVKAATVDDDGARAESHTIDVPYASREALLTRLRADMYEDAMALDTREIAGGATTATQIRAAYEPLNSKADYFEYQIGKFLDRLLYVAGIEDEYSFARSTIVNKSEEISTVLSAAEYLTDDYITEKVLTILGDGDKVEEILKQISADELERGGLIGSGTVYEPTGESVGEENNTGISESV